MNRLNLDQLMTFANVVRLSGVRKAAVALNLTQPAVTSRIKALEQSLATSLFVREGGRMKLTEKGELLFKYVEQFEHLAELVKRDVMDPSGHEGLFRIGVSETIAQCWLPELLTALRERYPKLEIELNVDISSNLRAALLDHEIDLALLLGPISEFSIENIVLPEFQLSWYCAPGDSLHTKSEAILSKKPVITYALNTRPERELRKTLFDRYGPDFSLLPCSSLSTCFRMVETGLGVAALPELVARDYVQRGIIVEFDPGWIPNPLVFSASYRSRPVSTIALTAANLAREIGIENQNDKNIL